MIGFSVQTCTPCTASTIDLKPWKSMPRKLSTRSPETCWTTLVVHSGPPTA